VKTAVFSKYVLKNYNVSTVVLGLKNGKKTSTLFYAPISGIFRYTSAGSLFFATTTSTSTLGQLRNEKTIHKRQIRAICGGFRGFISGFGWRIDRYSESVLHKSKKSV
jgi:hypothetical protein